MGLQIIEKEDARASANSGITKGGDTFGGGIPYREGSFFELGDTFTVPQTYTVFNQVFGSGKTQFIIVDVMSAAGVQSAKRLYPSTFTKSRMIANEDGTLSGKRVIASGTAVALYRNHSTVEEGMCALKGKTLKVTAVTPVRCLFYGTTQVTTTNILTIDIVESAE